MKTSFPVALLLLAGLSLVGTLSWSDEATPTSNDIPDTETTRPDALSIEEENRRLDEAFAGIWRFRATLDQTLSDLMCDAVTLDNAIEIVINAAETDNPAFLQYLKRNHPTRSDHGNVSEALQQRLELLEACAAE